MKHDFSYFSSNNNPQKPNVDLDLNDPEIKGRFWNQFKGTFKSHARDPWMESSFRINAAFLNWHRAEKKRQFGSDPGLANLQAEIRNDFIRAGDLWQDYQATITEKSTTDLDLQNNNLLTGFLSLEKLERWENHQRESIKNISD
jgi:hypothetical protein